MNLSRRDVLFGFAAVGVAGALPMAWSAREKPLAERFVVPLAIPPELHGREQNGLLNFDLRVQPGRHSFARDLSTPTIGINGSYLGPVLRVPRGQAVRMQVSNGLNEQTTLHWHGARIPGEMDGGPHQIIAPGATWAPRFTLTQPASTLWYHSHMYHRTGPQVYKGMAGLLYVDDPALATLGLPQEYGVDDIPLVLQDRRFNRDGSFRYLGHMRDRMVGVLGDVMLTNGTPYPLLDIQRRRVRLRVLNGSNARIYDLAFSDGRPFQQIATDGGLLAAPVRLNQLRLAPGERAEIVVEFQPGDDLMLMHQPRPEPTRSRGMGMMGMMGNMSPVGRTPFPILRLRAAASLQEGGRVPARLAQVDNWSLQDAVGQRPFEMDMQMGPAMMSGGGFTINGKSMSIRRIDETIRRGNVEVWAIRNASPMPHPFHVHGTQFRILDRNGGSAPANEQGLKDTVLVNPDETVRVITRFDHLAGPAAPFMYHCHNLEHEDAGMMGQFTVQA